MTEEKSLTLLIGFMMENKIRLEGKKVYLTSITYDDCEDFIKWRNSDFIKARFIYRKDLTIEEQNAWVKNKVETGEVIQFIIWDKEKETKIGCVYIQNIDLAKKEAEFGILIGNPSFIGGGRGTESAKLIIDYVFNILAIDRIYLRVLSENSIAIKSYETVGFKPDDRKEVLMIDGEEKDILFMSIER